MDKQMEKERSFRHEFKYLISGSQVALLQSRLRGLAHPDPHAGPRGCYSIRSLYFDDPQDSCLQENLCGADPREKFRIRIYDRSDARISLECKRKERSMTKKTACLLSREDCLLLMQGRSPFPNDLPPVYQKLALGMRCCGLRPAVIVEYERIPYVCQFGNVRITFDLNVSSSPALSQFLSPGPIPRRPIMPRGMQLMEVKYDAFLPDVLKQALQTEHLTQTAYSKYALCREFSLSAGLNGGKP